MAVLKRIFEWVLSSGAVDYRKRGIEPTELVIEAKNCFPMF